MAIQSKAPLELKVEKRLGRLEFSDEKTPIENATWYSAHDANDGFAYRFPAGFLTQFKYLTFDLLLEGHHLVIFSITMQEGDNGPVFHFSFGALNECSARLRMLLSATNQNQWRFEREGALLKPLCWGERVDLNKVDRMTLSVYRKHEGVVRWCMTPLMATTQEPPLLDKLILTKGRLLDELGQYMLHDWPGKSKTPDEVTTRLQTQLRDAPKQQWPKHFSRWGGWTEKRFTATGFFRTQHDGKRWWLVDPDGYAFWSAGQDCVRVDTAGMVEGLREALTWLPEEMGAYAACYEHGEGHTFVNYLAANCIRAFGEDWYERWAEIALAELKRTGFNTVANWSDWKIAKIAGFPYVRPLELHFANTPMIFRDFPDVFHEDFEKDVAQFAEQLRETADDSAFIGYFLMNEPTWGFSPQSPAEGMLFNTPTCQTRTALADFLRDKYKDDRTLSAAWNFDTTLGDIAAGNWNTPLTSEARIDLESFSTIMTEKLFSDLSAACKKVDPNHLNLGARYYSVPPEWALKGMKSFDVFSVNGYDKRIKSQWLKPFSELLERPVMVGEFHFGALDVGLPGSGIVHVTDQEARAKAFRVYTEDAAAQPWCVGVHHFTLYDESALGRYDGENWNIGFLDVCNRPYDLLANAARTSHERLYQIATGELEPYQDEPEYLPPVFV